MLWILPTAGTIFPIIRHTDTFSVGTGWGWNLSKAQRDWRRGRTLEDHEQLWGAQLVADRLGEIGPLHAAIALTARNLVKTRLPYLYKIYIIYSKNSVYIYSIYCIHSNLIYNISLSIILDLRNQCYHQCVDLHC